MRSVGQIAHASHWARCSLRPCDRSIKSTYESEGNMTQRQNYNPSRRGHAPGRMRDSLLEALRDHWDDPEEKTWWRHLDIKVLQLKTADPMGDLDFEGSAIWLAGQFWNCQDSLPGSVCALAGFLRGSTYAQLVRRLRSDLKVSSDCNTAVDLSRTIEL